MLSDPDTGRVFANITEESLNETTGLADAAAASVGPIRTQFFLNSRPEFC